MDETIEYLGERFPDLTDVDLRDLYAVGIRFCQPAIPHGNRLTDVVEDTESTEAIEPSEATSTEATEDTEPPTAGIAEQATAGVAEETESSSTAAA